MTPRKRPAPLLRPRWATIAETADHCRKSTDTIRRWIASGAIPAKRDPGGAGLRVDLNEVDARFVAVPSAKAAS
jgi:hypothetical protein